VTIDDILEDVLANEGGYVNDPRDTGGETMFGITAAVARANGYTGPMRDLPRAKALAIYRDKYVVAPGFALVAAVSAPIAAELVDTGVNMGPTIAGRFLQRGLNLVTDAALAVDGQVGPMTVRVLSGFIAKRGKVGEARLLALLNAFQGTRYAELAEGRSANRAFLYGWLARIMPVALLALTLSACTTTPTTICTGSDLRRTAYTATIAAADAWTASGRPVPSKVMLARMGAVAALGLLNGRCPVVPK
jgi:lysozyme family protein